MSRSQPQTIDLLGTLSGEWIKLPLVAMQDVGPAVQTLGGILKITNKETFVPAADIARYARLPAATVRKHLVTLDERGLINHRGRERTRGGILRRTATIAVTKRTTSRIEPYGMLPWWACCTDKPHLPWCARAVLSIWMARLCSLKAAVDAQRGTDDAEEMAGAIDNLGGDDRFRFSLNWLAEQTGLTRDSVVIAKRLLNHRFGVVRWAGAMPKPGVTTESHYLLPNWNFRVLVTLAPKGGCYVAFDRGSKSGQ